MRWAAYLPVAVIASAGVATPVVAADDGRALILPFRDLPLAAIPARAVAPGGLRRFAKAGVRLAVTDKVDLFMKGGKDKPLAQSPGRQAEDAVGQTPKAIKLGVLIRW